MPRARAISDKRDIVREAFRIIDTEGAEALSLRSLAQNLGTSHMTLYNYFGRDELLKEVVKMGFDVVLRDLRPAMEAALEANDAPPQSIYLLIAEHLITFAEEHGHCYRFMFQTPSSTATRNEEVAQLYTIGAQLIRRRIGPTAYSRLETDSYLFLVMVNGLILAYLDGRHNTTKERCREQIRRGYELILGS